MFETPMRLAEPIQDDVDLPIVQPDQPTNLGIRSIPEPSSPYADDLAEDDTTDIKEIAAESEYYDEIYGDDLADMTWSLTDSLMLHLISEHGLIAALTMSPAEQLIWHNEFTGADHDPSDLRWRPEVALALVGVEASAPITPVAGSECGDLDGEDDDEEAQEQADREDAGLEEDEE